MVTGCSMPTKSLKTVPSVDINSFMGDWYVIAHIPAFIEKNAYNAIESYKLNDDGTIQTTFTFNEAAVDGERKNNTTPKALWLRVPIMPNGACNSFGPLKRSTKLFM